MIGAIEWPSNVPSRTAVAVAISSSDVRVATLNIFNPAKICFCMPEENPTVSDISSGR